MDSPVSTVNALVVDDDAQVCELIEDVAAEVGVTVVTARDFRGFQETFGQVQFDAIFLDLQMPDVDGVEYLRLLSEAGCEARITLMSGFDARVLRTARRFGESQKLRMEGVLEKPFDVDRLASLLLSLKESPQAISRDELQQAIANDELFMQYQPKVRLYRNGDNAGWSCIQAPSGSWRLDSLEALARWRHPTLGIVPPDRFIPLAESSQLIVPLTEYVVREVVGQLREWKTDGFDTRVSINWPAHMLTDLSAPDWLADLADENGVERERIALEITETAAMTDAVRAMDILTRIRLKGFDLSMDDFGTGYSSLVQLHRMPFRELKIDRSIVKEMNTSDDATKIVHAIVDLAHNLGLEVCAEGTEDIDIVRRLQEYGCDVAQGYHFAPAVDGQDVPLLVAEGGKEDPLDPDFRDDPLRASSGGE